MLAELAREVHALRSEVQTLRQAAKRGSSRMQLLLGLAVLAAVGGAVTAGAQVVTDSLKTFASGQPAIASDVNFNFNLMKKWVEHKVGTATTPAVTITGGATISNGATISGNATVSGQYGSLSMQGRVLSTNEVMYLSPPGGSYVSIEDGFRAAGGSTSAAGAGLLVEGFTTVNGELNVPNNTSTGSWRAEVNKAPAGGATVGAGGTPDGATWAKQECPSGQYLCGIAFTHAAGQNQTFDERYTIRCCSL